MGARKLAFLDAGLVWLVSPTAVESDFVLKAEFVPGERKSWMHAQKADEAQFRKDFGVRPGFPAARPMLDRVAARPQATCTASGAGPEASLSIGPNELIAVVHHPDSTAFWLM